MGDDSSCGAPVAQAGRAAGPSRRRRSSQPYPSMALVIVPLLLHLRQPSSQSYSNALRTLSQFPPGRRKPEPHLVPALVLHMSHTSTWGAGVGLCGNHAVSWVKRPKINFHTVAGCEETGAGVGSHEHSYLKE